MSQRPYTKRAARLRAVAYHELAGKQLPGIGGASSKSWNGDRLTFSVVAMGHLMEIELTGVLGMIASRLKDRLQRARQQLLTKR